MLSAPRKRTNNALAEEQKGGGTSGSPETATVLGEINALPALPGSSGDRARVVACKLDLAKTLERIDRLPSFPAADAGENSYAKTIGEVARFDAGAGVAGRESTEVAGAFGPEKN